MGKMGRGAKNFGEKDFGQRHERLNRSRPIYKRVDRRERPALSSDTPSSPAAPLSTLRVAARRHQAALRRRTSLSPRVPTETSTITSSSGARFGCSSERIRVSSRSTRRVSSSPSNTTRLIATRGAGAPHSHPPLFSRSERPPPPRTAAPLPTEGPTPERSARWRGAASTTSPLPPEPSRRTRR